MNKLYITLLFLFSIFSTKGMFVSPEQLDSLGEIPTLKQVIEKKVKDISVHIFVHGTRCSGLALVSAIPTLKGSLTDERLYPTTIHAIRKDERFNDTQIMLQDGLVEVSHETIKQCKDKTLLPAQSSKTAIQAITGYSELIHNHAINLYYTFGWDGMLDDGYRKRAALMLYEAIINLRDELCRRYGRNPHHLKFVLHGHSHGGNVVLYLPFHAKSSDNLIIDTTILYGTPIQMETAYYCVNHMFKRVISIHSEGDSIQVADRFSTDGKSMRHLSDYIDLEKYNTEDKQLIDVCVSANGNTHAFSHGSFFLMADYTTKYPALAELNPLPLATYTPCFLELIEKIQVDRPLCCTINLDIISDRPGQCIIWAQVPGTSCIHTSENIAPKIAVMRTRIHETWTPHAHHGHVKLGLRAAAKTIASIPTFVRQKLASQCAYSYQN